MVSVALSYMAGRGRRKQPGRAWALISPRRASGAIGRIVRTVHTVPRSGR